jgi:hypothetical protein
VQRPYDRHAVEDNIPFVAKPIRHRLALLTCRSRQAQAGQAKRQRHHAAASGTGHGPLCRTIVATGGFVRIDTHGRPERLRRPFFRSYQSGSPCHLDRPGRNLASPRPTRTEEVCRNLAGVVGACSRDPSGRPRLSAFRQRIQSAERTAGVMLVVA